MADEELPQVLLVDDQVELAAFGFQQSLDGRASTRSRLPGDVSLRDLEWADLVLVDHRIDRWPERDELESIGLRPLRGVSLAAVFREHIDLSGDATSPTAFAVHSGHLDDLALRLRSERPAHVIAQMNNLEWAFAKGADGLEDQIASLATAIQSLTRLWEGLDQKRAALFARAVLGLDGRSSPWEKAAWNDVLRCQVPLVRPEPNLSGLLLVRWLLQAIIPYPTFLVSDYWAAAELRMSVDNLRESIRGESPLASELSKFEYSGLLHGMSGRRWWRSGVEHLAWRLREDNGASRGEYHAALQEMAGVDLQQLEFNSPVVTLNANLQPAEIVDVREAVRLVPDLWPKFADEAYAKRSLVEAEEELQAIIHPLDASEFGQD